MRHSVCKKSGQPTESRDPKRGFLGVGLLVKLTSPLRLSREVHSFGWIVGPREFRGTYILHD